MNGLRPELRVIGEDTAEPSVIVLVLPGGKAASTSPATDQQLSARRMVPLARAAHAALTGAGETPAVRLLRYRYRGWNGPASDPVRDAHWALADLRERHPAIPVLLVGHSMGGRTALRVAGDPAVTAVCALAPWIEAGDPVRQLAGTEVVIAHGDRDRWTRPSASFEFAVALRRITPDVCRFVVHGTGHAMLRRAADWTELVRRFVLGATGEPDPVIAAAMATPGPDGLRVPLPRGLAHLRG